jgi:hypothetical protein
MVRAKTGSPRGRSAGIALALLALALPATALAADDPILAKLVGEWTGNGTFRQSAQAAPERIFCKVTNTLSENGSALTQKGRCSVASNSGPIDGLIKADGAGKYSGTLKSLASDGPAALSGSGSGGRLTLETAFIDARTHEPAKSLTTMELSSAGYRLVSERRDTGPAWTANDITFTK